MSEYFDFFSPANATSNKTLDGIDWKLLYEVAHKQYYLIRCIIELKINTQKALHEMIKYNGMDASGTGVKGYLTPGSRCFYYKETQEERDKESIRFMAEKWEDIVKYLFCLQNKIKTGEFNKSDVQPDMFGD